MESLFSLSKQSVIAYYFVRIIIHGGLATFPRLLILALYKGNYHAQISESCK